MEETVQATCDSGVICQNPNVYKQIALFIFRPPWMLFLVVFCLHTLLILPLVLPMAAECERSPINRTEGLDLQETARWSSHCELRFFLDLRESCIRIESFLAWRRSYLCASLYYIQPPSLQSPTRTLCNLLNTCGKLKVSVILDKVEYMDSCALSHDPAHSPCNKKAEETSTSKLMSGFQIKKWELYGKGAFCL